MDKDTDKLINDYLESNGLQQHKDLVINIRHKLYDDVPETLYDVLEGFNEYLKHNKL